MLPVITRLVRSNAENPGLKLAVALERTEVFDDGKKHFLADFLGILARQIMSQLENETPGRRVVQVKKFVPGFRLALAAALD